MGPLKFKLHYSGPTPRGMARELPRIQQRALETMGVYWHQHFRAKHFTPSGAREYGYAPRKGEGMAVSTKGFWRTYMGRKLRMKGHQNPLVWSGESRERTRMRDVRATRNRVRVVLHANALNFRNPHSRTKPWEEMTTVSAAEQRVLSELFNREIERGIAAIRSRQTVTIQ